MKARRQDIQCKKNGPGSDCSLLRKCDYRCLGRSRREDLRAPRDEILSRPSGSDWLRRWPRFHVDIDLWEGDFDALGVEPLVNLVVEFADCPETIIEAREVETHHDVEG